MRLNPSLQARHDVRMGFLPIPIFPDADVALDFGFCATRTRRDARSIGEVTNCMTLDDACDILPRTTPCGERTSPV